MQSIFIAETIHLQLYFAELFAYNVFVQAMFKLFDRYATPTVGLLALFLE